RAALLLAGPIALQWGEVSAQAQPAAVRVVVDLDDDDGNGVADGRQEADVPLVDAARLRVLLAPGARFDAPLHVRKRVRLLVDGIPVPAGATLPADGSGLWLQAREPGHHVVDLGTTHLEVRAVQVLALDGRGNTVDFARSHASFQRTPPDRLDTPTANDADPDSLRFLFVGQPGDLPSRGRIVSRREDGGEVDALLGLELLEAKCPKDVAPGLTCRSTWPIRVVADPIDQGHPLVMGRSIRAELGGALLVEGLPWQAQQIRIGGPRRTALGPVRRHRATLRMTVLRPGADEATALGRTTRATIARAREQVRGANALWAQCGITFGPPETADIRIVDPPPASLLAVGCDLGTPSTGGRIHLVVDGRDVTVDTAAGQTPRQVARLLAQGLRARGLTVTLSPNSLIEPGALQVVDLWVQSNGRPAQLAAPAQGPVSTDGGLPVCIGRVSLSQGIRHFLDVDSMAGTVSERTLLKWVDDRDPGTLDAVMIPAFAGGGRIGESFVGNDQSSLRNLVLLDRAGVGASQASHTLAHEMGHVILDVPGHPDDYGVDTPTLLMDSDAADPTAFGPRRLTVAECERALRQAGPGAPVQLLTPWSWSPLAKPSRY
ncbi:MAG: hypothetical protein MUF54_18335, partial [Polyangiaceae bacterium]|nr:hypothetical protein [Polyangiaceae bacterium]